MWSHKLRPKLGKQHYIKCYTLENERRLFGPGGDVTRENIFVTLS
jgi:hypothetical protein